MLQVIKHQCNFHVQEKMVLKGFMNLFFMWPVAFWIFLIWLFVVGPGHMQFTCCASYWNLALAIKIICIRAGNASNIQFADNVKLQYVFLLFSNTFILDIGMHIHAYFYCTDFMGWRMSKHHVAQREAWYWISSDIFAQRKLHLLSRENNTYCSSYNTFAWYIQRNKY